VTDTAAETAEIVARPANITVYAYGMLDAPANVNAAAVGRVYTALAESKLLGNSPDKYGFVELRRTADLCSAGHQKAIVISERLTARDRLTATLLVRHANRENIVGLKACRDSHMVSFDAVERRAILPK